MSVLIKRMEMPKCCLECPFEDSPEFDSYCIAIGNEFIGEWEGLGMYKPDWCPLEEPKHGEWIPVSERLPETMGEYLVTVLSNPSKNTIPTATFYNKLRKEFGIYKADFSWEKWDVVAWMPLPDAYREDGE